MPSPRSIGALTDSPSTPDRGHCHLRRHRRMIASLLAAVRSGRRGDLLRSVLRELRTGHSALRSATAHRSVASAGVELRSRGVCAPAPSPGEPRLSFSIRRTTPPARSSHARSSSSLEVCAASSTRSHHRRNLRAHRVRRRAAHTHGDASRAMREHAVLVNSMSKTFSVTGGASAG